MVAADQLDDELAADGAAPVRDSDRGEHRDRRARLPAAFVELMRQCAAAGIEPAAIVHTSSSGGTHAGLVAGRALWRSLGNQVPDVLAIGVAKGVNVGTPDIVGLAGEALELLGRPHVRVDSSDVQLDPDWLGDDYAVPTAAGDDAIRWAATHRRLGPRPHVQRKGLAGLLGNAAAGRWRPVPTSCSSTPAGCRPCSRPAAARTHRSAVIRPSLRPEQTGRWVSFRMSEILDVDLLAFERGIERPRDGRSSTASRRSLQTGFVYTSHDLSEDMLDTAYGMLREFFSLHGVEAAFERARRQRSDRVHGPARRDRGVERPARLEGDAQLVVADPGRTPAEAQVRHRLSRPGAARVGRAGDHRRAVPVPRLDRRSAAAVPPSDRRGDRLPRDVLRRDGHRWADAHPRDPLSTDARGARGGPRVGGPARRHQPDHRAAPGDRTGPPGAGRRRWVDAVRPRAR